MSSWERVAALVGFVSLALAVLELLEALKRCGCR